MHTPLRLPTGEIGPSPLSLSPSLSLYATVINLLAKLRF